VKTQLLHCERLRAESLSERDEGGGARLERGRRVYATGGSHTTIVGRNEERERT
jgi:hypothetical protein